MGKHSAEEGKQSTSEQITGKRNQEHVAKHAAKEPEVAGSDLPHRDGRQAEH